MKTSLALACALLSTVASAQALSFSSGRYFETSASGSISPSLISIVASRPVKDLLIDHSACGSCAAMPA